ncbi:hypothetical protein EU520_00695 [Candidatus Thorarchaeota archaeon]|nr:MAG: hypothetical protein EU520_00695 [Candidatus Thorarchaeota archaeon]
MVKGPCRGKKCDFWARIKLKKKSVREIAEDMQDAICECESGNGRSQEDAFRQYWSAFGIKVMARLIKEEPDLYSKIERIEALITETN